MCSMPAQHGIMQSSSFSLCSTPSIELTSAWNIASPIVWATKPPTKVANRLLITDPNTRMPQLRLPEVNKLQPRCSTGHPQPPLLTHSNTRTSPPKPTPSGSSLTWPHIHCGYKGSVVFIVPAHFHIYQKHSCFHSRVPHPSLPP